MDTKGSKADSTGQNGLPHYSTLLKNHMEAGLYDEAEQFVSMVTDQFLAAAPSHTKAHYAKMVGDMYSSRGKYQLAGDYFKRSRDLYSQLKDPNGVVEASIGMSKTSQSGQDITERIKTGYQALALADSIGEESKVADIKVLIGRLFLEGGNANAAKPLMEQAQDFYKRGGEPVSLALVHHDLARLYSINGEMPQAIGYATSALNIGKKLSDNGLYTQSCQLLGQLYGQSNDWNLSLEHYNNALRIAERSGESKQLAMLYLERSDISMKAGLLAAGEQDLEEYYRVAKKMALTEADVEYFRRKLLFDERLNRKDSLELHAELLNRFEDNYNTHLLQSMTQEEQLRLEMAQREKELQKEIQQIEMIREQEEKSSAFRSLLVICLVGFGLLSSLVAREALRSRNAKTI